jgi:hypothetical protein
MAPRATVRFCLPLLLLALSLIAFTSSTTILSKPPPPKRSPPPRPRPPPPRKSTGPLLLAFDSTKSFSNYSSASQGNGQVVIGGAVLLNITAAQSSAPFAPTQVVWQSCNITSGTVQISVPGPFGFGSAQVTTINGVAHIKGSAFSVSSGVFSFTPTAFYVNATAITVSGLGLNLNIGSPSYAFPQQRLSPVQGALVLSGLSYSLNFITTLTLSTV